MRVKSYRDLLVWQKAMDAAQEVYRLVKILPREELFALSDQMRRSAVSIASNIAEGYGRVSDTELLRYLKISYGSLTELETQLYLCCRIGYMTEDDVQKALELLDETGKMITALSNKIKTENKVN